MSETPFIARRWANGLGLTAVLPTVPGDGPELCAIYDIPGQHGSGSAYRELSSTEPASPEETEQLRKELQQIGYPTPTPYKRLSQRMHRERRQAWRAMLDALARQVDVSRESNRLEAVPDPHGQVPDVDMLVNGGSQVLVEEGN